MNFLNLMYKNSYWLLVGILFMTSCKSSTKETNNTQQTTTQGTNDAQEKKLTINGTVKASPKNGIAVLEKLQGQRYAVVDSMELNAGKFVFEVKIAEPEFYRVVLFKKQAIYMILIDKDLEIVADATVPEIPYTVKGSKDMDYFRVVNREMNKLGQEKNKLESQYVLAKKNEEAKAKEIFQQLIALQKKGIATMKGMIDTIQPSFAALYASNILNPDEEYPYLKKLSDNLSKNYPNSRYVKRYAEFLKSISALTVGQPAPEITLTSPQGKQVSLSSLKGKLVLIDFWASWCKPCRMENPNVVGVYQDYKDKGFEIFGVSLDRNKKDWMKAIKDDKMSWVHVSDLKMWQSSVVPQYKVQGIPLTYLVDKEGKILAKNLRGEALRKRVSQELDTK